MELGLQLYGCAGYWRRDAARFFEDIRAMGYTSVEPCVWFGEGEAPPFAWERSSLPDYARLLDARGLGAPSCFINTDRPLSASIDALRRAAASGFRYFVIGGGSDWDVRSVAALAREYGLVADALAKEGAELWYHNSWKEFQRRLHGRHAWEYLMECAEGRFGAQLDTGWAAYGGGDLDAVIRRNGAMIRSIHHKDIQDRITPVDRLINVPLGKGIVDTETAFEFARRESLYQLVDLDNSEGDFLDALRQSAGYLAELDDLPAPRGSGGRRP